MSEKDETTDIPPLKMEMETLPDVAAAPEIYGIEIIELLGKGGMSIVYKARQRQLDRIVAVKVLSKIAVSGEDAKRRFQKEAKLTSALDHPNIVKIISFGVSTDGQPYLVMEYLEGMSLADELKQNGRLSLQKFKDVFLPVLSALNQAHEAGLVHRDIKPTNIMICRNDTGSEAVKLVDFGIAKFSGEKETLDLTRSGALLGTPTYMSPEQCQGKPLDRRSDLYSLACVMYETLTGEPPFSGESPLEVMQKHSVESPPTVSDLSCKIDVDRELAAVILRGLAKDPAARPQTASELASKLKEVLERTTLDKVPRLKKSGAASSRIALQKPLTIALVLCTVVLCTGLAVFINSDLQHHEEKGDPSRAASSPKQRKEDNSERMYKASLAQAEKAHHLNASELLNRLEALAGLYHDQQRWSEVEALQKRMVAIREKLVSAPNSQDEAEKLADNLAALGWSYVRQGQHAKANPLFKRALAIKEKLFGPDNPKLGAALCESARYYQDGSKYAEAEPLLKRALALVEKEYNPNAPEIAHGLNTLANCYNYQKKYAEAESLSKRALAILERVSDPNSLDLEEGLCELANCYEYEHKYAEAEPLLKRALKMLETKLGPNNPVQVNILYKLARHYEVQDKCAMAEPLLKHALEILEKAHDPDDPVFLEDLDALANCYEHQQKYAEAEPLLERGLAISEKAYGPTHPVVTKEVDMLADCYRHQGKRTEEEQLHKRAPVAHPG